MENKFDVITVGNALIDAFLSLHNAAHACRVDPATGELCVKQGEKIELDASDFQSGGNACNVSVGLSRLGYKTALVAEIGADEFSEKISNGLKKEGVNMTHVIKKGSSSFAMALNFQNERTLFVQHQKRDHAFSFGEMQTKWVYLTSLGDVWQDAYQKTLDYIQSDRILLAFNPGTKQLSSDITQLTDLLAHTQILFVNKEEAARLAGEDLSVELLLPRLQKYGPRIVVITDGEKGAAAIDYSGQIHRCGVIPSEVVEKTGAGDALASGFLGAILAGKTIDEALIWGSVNASYVIGQVGAQPGLLFKEEMIYQTSDIAFSQEQPAQILGGVSL